MAKTVLGFDFGSANLKIAKVTDGRIVATEHYPLPDSIIKDGSIVSYDALSDVIREAMKETKLGNAPAAVVLPLKQVVVRRLEMPLMTVDQLAINLPYEFHDFLDMDKDKYYYDYLVNEIKEDRKIEDFEELSNPESSGPVMDLTAAAVPKELIQDYRTMFKNAGLKLVTAIPSEMAYANILRAANVPDGKESCFIQLGFSTSTVAFFKGCICETARVKETGLSVIEEMVAEDKNIDIHTAREWLRSNYQGVQDSEYAKTVYNAVAADIRKTINFYQYSNKDSELTDIYCLGGGSNIPAYYQSITETAEIDFVPLDKLLPGTDSSTLSDFALAIGAALQ